MKTFRFFFALLSIVGFSATAMAQGSWVLQRAFGLSPSQNPQIIFSAVNKDVCWGCSYNSSQFVRTTDGGAHWTVGTIPANSGLIGSRIAAIESNTAFVILHGTSGGGIFKTSDGGLTWTRYPDAYNETDSNPLQVYFFDSSDGVCVGDPSRGNWEIYTTSNGGTDWNRVPSANIPTPFGGETALYRGHANGADNCFWFTTWSGFLYRTSDRGITWTATPNVLGNYNGFSVAFKDSLNGVACTPLQAGGLGNKISITSDGGKTWQPVDVKFGSPSCYALNYIKGSNNDYILTSDYNKGEPGYSFQPGTAYSSDGGMTCEVVDKTSRLWADFSPDGTGWSGGENDSIYKWVPSNATSVPANSGQSYGFKLSQNYPNPFNPSTTIEYSIPQSAFVTLKVYDVLGREVTSLVNRDQQEGEYEVQLNGSNLASGMYFYRITAGKFVDTKRLILLK
jgi:photosystem II stability/assembly factor-like uncharacterized protein